MVRIYCAYPKDLALIQSPPCKIHPFAMPDTSLDAFDIAILDILQQDNTTPQRAIAEAVHLSPAAVQRRIRRLNASGVVRANVALLEPTRVGQMLTILVEVQLVSERPELALPLRQRILEEPSVQQCYYITGEADYLLVLTVASMEAYAELTERLFAHDTNVRRFRTSVALGRLKAGMRLPLPSFTPTPPAGATA